MIKLFRLETFKSVLFVALPADDFNMVSVDALFVYW